MLIAKKLRIAIVTPTFPPEIYTSSSMFQSMAEELAVKGHEVTVITTFPNRPEGVLYPGYTKQIKSVAEKDGYRIIRCWTWFIGRRRSLFGRAMEQATFALSAAVQFVQAGRFDIVIHCPWAGFCAYFLSLVYKVTSSRFYYYIQDFMPEQAENAGFIKRNGTIAKLIMWFEKKVCKKSDGLLVLSEGFKQHCIRTRGIESSNILVSPIYIDSNAIYPVKRNNVWRRAQGIAANTFVILYSGTMGYVSGLSILKDVLAKIPEELDVLFVCVGEGPLKPALENLARNNKKIKCLPFQSASDYVLALGTADITLLTMDEKCGQGSVPSKMYTYMAAGKAVLSNAPPASENARIISDTGCGILVPPNDPAALASKIMELKQDAAPLKTMGESGYQYIIRNCTVHSSIERLEKFWGNTLFCND